MLCIYNDSIWNTRSLSIYDYIYYRVHDYAYIKHLQDKCAQVNHPPPTAATTGNKKTPKGSISKSMLFADSNTTTTSTTNKNGNGSGSNPSFYAPSGYLDLDTPLTTSSLDAAKQFCG